MPDYSWFYLLFLSTGQARQVTCAYGAMIWYDFYTCELCIILYALAACLMLWNKRIYIWRTARYWYWRREKRAVTPHYLRDKEKYEWCKSMYLWRLQVVVSCQSAVVDAKHSRAHTRPFAPMRSSVLRHLHVAPPPGTSWMTDLWSNNEYTTSVQSSSDAEQSL